MRRYWNFDWLELIEGILLLLLGIVSLMKPGTALTGVVMIYGLIAVITGIGDIIFFAKVNQYTGVGPTISLAAGIMSVMAGVMLLVHPGAGAWILTLLIPIWFIAHCISKLTRLPVIRMFEGKTAYYFSMIVNIIGLVLGCLMIFKPWITLLSVDWIIGIYLIMLGIDSIIMAFESRKNIW